MGERGKGGFRLRKSQFSLEFLLLAAAFLAFAGVFSLFAGESFAKSVFASRAASAKEKLAAACFYVDFFSLDGRGALAEKSFAGFSSQGRKMVFSNFSRECRSQFRFEGGLLSVENAGLEAR